MCKHYRLKIIIVESPNKKQKLLQKCLDCGETIPFRGKVKIEKIQSEK